MDQAARTRTAKLPRHDQWALPVNVVRKALLHAAYLLRAGRAMLSRHITFAVAVVSLREPPSDRAYCTYTPAHSTGPDTPTSSGPEDTGTLLGCPRV